VGLLERLRKSKRFIGVSLREGQPACCKHFEDHRDEADGDELILRSYESAYQDIDLISSDLVNTKKRKSLKHAFPMDVAPCESSMRTEISTVHWKEGNVSTVFHDEEVLFGDASDQKLDSSSDIESAFPSPVRRLHSPRAALSEESKDLSSDSVGSSPTIHTVDKISLTQVSRLDDLTNRLHEALLMISHLKQEATQSNKELLEHQAFLDKKLENMRAMDVILRDLHVGDGLVPLVQDGNVTPREMEKIFEERLLWLGVRNFETLWNDVRPYLRVASRGPKPTFSLMQELAITLIWIRRGFGKGELATICGLSNTSITNIVTKICEDLQFWAYTWVKLPNLDEWQRSTPKDFMRFFPNTLLFFVDGTVLQIYRSDMLHINRDHWNPKHKIVSITFTILITPDGKIVFASEPYPGKTHDRKVWYQSGINQQLVETYGILMEKLRRQENVPTLAIGGDKGYIGLIMPQLWKLYITKSAKKVDSEEKANSWDDVKSPSSETKNLTVPLTSSDKSPSSTFQIGKVSQEMQSYPTGLAQFRSMVERTIAEVKDFNLLENRSFTTDYMSGQVTRVIQLACALVNFNKENSIEFYLVVHCFDRFFCRWRRNIINPLSLPSTLLRRFNFMLYPFSI
jgi:hypothetical protein